MAKLTKKDFKEIADIFKEAKLSEGERGRITETAVDRIIKDFIPFLKSSNPNFNKEKFLDYIEERS